MEGPGGNAKGPLPGNRQRGCRTEGEGAHCPRAAAPDPSPIWTPGSARSGGRARKHGSPVCGPGRRNVSTGLSLLGGSGSLGMKQAPGKLPGGRRVWAGPEGAWHPRTKVPGDRQTASQQRPRAQMPSQREKGAGAGQTQGGGGVVSTVLYVRSAPLHRPAPTSALIPAPPCPPGPASRLRPVRCPSAVGGKSGRRPQSP